MNQLDMEKNFCHMQFQIISKWSYNLLKVFGCLYYAKDNSSKIKFQPIKTHKRYLLGVLNIGPKTTLTQQLFKLRSILY